MTPAQVWACSVWEFQAAVDGYIEANSSGSRATEAEMDDVWNWLLEKDGLVH